MRLGLNPHDTAMRRMKVAIIKAISLDLYILSDPPSKWHRMMKKSCPNELRPVFFGDHHGHEISHLGDAGKRGFLRL